MPFNYSTFQSNYLINKASMGGRREANLSEIEEDTFEEHRM